MAYLAISRRAARDIDEIRSYSVEHWGPSVAEEYLDSIEEALERLRGNPSLLRYKPEFSPHFRFYRVRRHYLVCSTVENNIYLASSNLSSSGLIEASPEYFGLLLFAEALPVPHCSPILEVLQGHRNKFRGRAIREIRALGGLV
jgi:plasmid stabilization system protein ParE